MEGLLLSLISGGIGGNIAGALLKGKSLGMLWNTVVGVLGGGAGSQILDAVGVLEGGGMISNIGGSTVGGAVLLLIVSMFKKK